MCRPAGRERRRVAQRQSSQLSDARVPVLMHAATAPLDNCCRLLPRPLRVGLPREREGWRSSYHPLVSNAIPHSPMINQAFDVLRSKERLKDKA
eukprot:4256541-Prymnesium_polylepis.2